MPLSGLKRRVLSRASTAVSVSAAAAVLVVSSGVVGAAPVWAAEDAPTAAGLGFVARVVVGVPGPGARQCSGVLVAPRWVVTDKACFATGSGSVVEGPPPRVSKVLFGSPDLSQAAGQYAVSVVRVVPHPDRDVVLARLAVPVTAVAPVAIASAAPAVEQVLQVAGYGRTDQRWIPDVAHAGTVTVGAVTGTSVDVTANGSQQGPCPGDAGGAGLREGGGTVELVAISHAGKQGGCVGAASDAARDATLTRVDDLGAWFGQRLSEPTVNLVIGDNSDLCLAISAASTAKGTHAIQWPCGGGVEQDWRMVAHGDGTFEIRNDHSDMCLGIGNASTEPGAAVLQWPCGGVNNTELSWDLVTGADGYTEVRNVNSKQCLAIGSALKDKGVDAIQWPCRGEKNREQYWKIQSRTVGTRVSNKFSGFCISNGGSKDNAALIVQVACNDANDAEWHLQAARGGYAQVRNDRSSQCVAIGGGSGAEGVAAIQWPCVDGRPEQQWSVDIDVNGRTRLRNANSGKCLAVKGAVKTSGANMVQVTCSDANKDQYWEVADATYPTLGSATLAPVAAGSLVEDFSYPGGAATPGITLLRGDGHIIAATCVAGQDQVKATALDDAGVKHDFCFEVKGEHGYLSLTLKGAYLLWADEHTVTATISIDDKSETRIIDPHQPTGVGIGETRNEATLLELRV